MDGLSWAERRAADNLKADSLGLILFYFSYFRIEDIDLSLIRFPDKFKSRSNGVQATSAPKHILYLLSD